ncbi:ArnT family glycosyltransferase [Gimesia aquarii]|uniref:Glycosyltransferase RgtA/B/C/D-like domain-containing protein n=1 Tax=Gimesia aquarii TaxID=2527964 RepID=A0A517W315_9PLAN|nr:hypothetical protein [Gimesia aquarii]QDT99620.1 hypothetical protein V144x_51320 [Gimesia aquarii]
MKDPARPQHITSIEDNPIFVRGALIWLLLFFITFISFTLPNNPSISRWDIVTNIPYLLLDLVDPLPEENPHPAGWSYFPQRFPLIGIALVILTGAWGLGQIVTRLIRIPLAPFTIERTVFAYGVGISGVSLLTLGGGLLGILSQTLCYLVLGLSALLGGISAYTESKRNISPTPPLKQSPSDTVSQETIFRGACCLLIFPFVLSMFLGSMLPSTDFDVLEYHFGGPKEFYQQGCISFLPHNVYTSFPFLTEMLTLLAMSLKADWYFGAQAGKLVLMSFSLFTALGIFAAARRWFGSETGWLAATIYLTTPWTYRISIIALTEGALSFYLMSSLLALMLTIQILKSFSICIADRPPTLDSNQEVAPNKKLCYLYGYTCLTGLLSGSAMACKYPGVLSVVIPIGLALLGFSWALLKHDKQQRMSVTLKLAGIFSLGTLLTIGPWLLKNLWETGNPVYPLLYSVFGGIDLNDHLNTKWKGGHSPKSHNPVNLGKNLIDVTMKSDWLSPLLFSLAPLAFLKQQHRRLIYWLWIYVGFLFLSWWVFTHRIDRFWVPMIPVASVLAGIGATWSSKRTWKTGAFIAILAAGLFNLCVVTSGLGGNNAYLDDLNYARKFTANLTGPEIMQLNQMQLGPNQVVLSVGDAELFNAEFPVIYSTVFDHEVFKQWTAEPEPGVPDKLLSMKSANKIKEKLKAERIAYIYVNWAEILRYRKPSSYGYTHYVSPGRFKKMVKEKVLLPALPNRFSYRKLDTLDNEELEELLNWAPELIIEREGERYFITAQIFPVAP